MKKLVIAFAVFCICVLQMNAQNTVSQLYDDFSSYKESESVHVNPFFMTFIRPFIGNSKDEKVAKKIDSVRVLDLENCSEKIKKEFCERVNKIKDKDYELLTRIKDEGDDVMIMVKAKKGTIHELLLLISGDEPTFIQLKGNIKQEDINGLFNEYGKKNDRRRI